MDYRQGVGMVVERQKPVPNPLAGEFDVRFHNFETYALLPVQHRADERGPRSCEGVKDYLILRSREALEQSLHQSGGKDCRVPECDFLRRFLDIGPYRY